MATLLTTFEVVQRIGCTAWAFRMCLERGAVRPYQIVRRRKLFLESDLPAIAEAVMKEGFAIELRKANDLAVAS